MRPREVFTLFSIRGLEGLNWRFQPTVEAIARWAERVVNDLEEALVEIVRVINGNLTFGDGVDYDNVAGQWILVTTAGADTDVTVNHTLGVVPVAFIVMVPPLVGAVNRGATPWTSTQIFVRCSAATQTFTIFVLPPPPSQ